MGGGMAEQAERLADGDDQTYFRMFTDSWLISEIPTDDASQRSTVVSRTHVHLKLEAVQLQISTQPFS